MILVRFFCINLRRFHLFSVVVVVVAFLATSSNQALSTDMQVCLRNAVFGMVKDFFTFLIGTVL